MTREELAREIKGQFGPNWALFVPWDLVSEKTFDALDALGMVVVPKADLNTILIASEFHAQDGVADHVMRYAHESTARLVRAMIAAEQDDD